MKGFISHLQVATEDAQIWSWSSNHYIVHGFTKHHNHPKYLGQYNLVCKQVHVAHLQKPSASHVTKLAQIPPREMKTISGEFMYPHNDGVLAIRPW